MLDRSPVLVHIAPRERRSGPARSRTRRRPEPALAALAAVATLAAVLASFALHLLSAGVQSAPRSISPHRLPPVSARSLRHDGDGTWAFDLAGFDIAAAPALGLHARAGLLVDAGSYRVLWARDPHAARPIASLTKLVTAMVALDAAGADAMVTVTGNAAYTDPSRMGVSAGERLTVEDLLMGLLLDSGNDAAEALADGLMPRDQFIGLMNARAAALHLHDTHFSTPSGLLDEDNHSSAYDLAVIAQEALRRYPEITKIAALRDAAVPAGAEHKAFYPHNRNHLLDIYPGADGLKTGFTDAAGGCIVATAVRNGRRLIAVLLGSDIMFGDAVRLLDYGFAGSGR